MPLHRVVGGSSRQGERAQHGKPQGMARDDQPDAARTDRPGAPGVAERFVMPLKPGKRAGGGRELISAFKTDCRTQWPGTLESWATYPTPGAAFKDRRWRRTRTGVVSCQSRMREICIGSKGSMSGSVETEVRAEPVSCRQTKGAATGYEICDLQPPRRTSGSTQTGGTGCDAGTGAKLGVPVRAGYLRSCSWTGGGAWSGF